MPWTHARRLGFILVLAWTWFPAASLRAQPAPEARIEEARAIAQAHRREWVRNQLVKLIEDPEQRRVVLRQLEAASDEQVQAIAAICLDELEARRQAQFQALRIANARTREVEARAAEFRAAEARAAEEAFARERFFRDELAWGLAPYPGYYAPTVGYVPVITWLPEGVGMNAQAVVSPDRRHVRLSVVPFFSSIGPVYTFNYMTGETRRYDR